MILRKIPLNVRLPAHTFSLCSQSQSQASGLDGAKSVAEHFRASGSTQKPVAPVACEVKGGWRWIPRLSLYCANTSGFSAHFMKVSVTCLLLWGERGTFQKEAQQATVWRRGAQTLSRGFAGGGRFAGATCFLAVGLGSWCGSKGPLGRHPTPWLSSLPPEKANSSRLSHARRELGRSRGKSSSSPERSQRPQEEQLKGSGLWGRARWSRGLHLGRLPVAQCTP